MLSMRGGILLMLFFFFLLLSSFFFDLVDFWWKTIFHDWMDAWMRYCGGCLLLLLLMLVWFTRRVLAFWNHLLDWTKCCSLQRQFTMIKWLWCHHLDREEMVEVQTHKPIYLFNEVNTMPLWQSQCQWQSYTHSQTHTSVWWISGSECLNWVLIGLDWCDILKKIPIYFDSWAFLFCHVSTDDWYCVRIWMYIPFVFFYLSGIVPSSVCCCRILFFHWIMHIACMYLSCMVEFCSLFQFQCCHQSQIHSLLIRFASFGGWKKIKRILSIFAVKIVLELTLTKSFDVVMLCFFFSFNPSYFDSSCSSFVGVLCFIFAAIQTPFMPNCVSFQFKRKFCVCQNNVARSSWEYSFFIHVFRSNRREKKILFAICFMKFPLKSIC